MTDDEALQALETNKHIRSEDEAKAFDEALAQLAQNPKTEWVPRLFLVLNDNCEHEEVMWGLLHFVEAFDLTELLKAFLQVLARLVKQAAEWTDIFHYRILNHEKARILYKDLLPSSDPETQAVARNILQKIATEEEPPLSTSAQFVLGS